MATTRDIIVLLCAALTLGVGCSAYGVQCEDPAAPCDVSEGYLARPPVYVVSEPDIPLTGFGIEMPDANRTVPAFDFVSVYSDHFVQDGQTVQPSLSVKFDTLRAGFLRGFKDGWAAGLSMPWQRTQVGNYIGGQPANHTVVAVGDLFLGGKKILWSGSQQQRLVAAVGLEMPTGFDASTFNESNPVTNAYYRNYPQRMPLSWQTGSGTWDALVGLSYGRLCSRLSYQVLWVTKFNGRGDEDVHIGNITILAATAGYGLSKNVAFGLELGMRSQSDDEYPNAPPPGVNQPALAGTTTHGAGLYLTPSIRFQIGKLAAIGLSYTVAVKDPDDGLVPRNQINLLFYPTLSQKAY